MTIQLSMKHLFQWAFALSPFPAYLPQYFAMMRRFIELDNGNASSVLNTINNNHLIHNNTNNNTAAVTNTDLSKGEGGGGTGGSGIMGDHNLRKRYPHDSPSSLYYLGDKATSSNSAIPNSATINNATTINNNNSATHSMSSVAANSSIVNNINVISGGMAGNPSKSPIETLSSGFERDKSRSNSLGGISGSGGMMLSEDRHYHHPHHLGGGNGISSGCSSNTNNGNHMDNNADKFDTGMSPATVFLLLGAHLLRMLYFHGLILEKKHPVHPRASAGDERDELSLDEGISGQTIGGGGGAASSREASNSHHGSMAIGSGSISHSDERLAAAVITKSTPLLPTSSSTILQWDLLGQSCSMIIVQLMLLHAMSRLRRKHQRIRRKRLFSESGTSNDTSTSMSGSNMSNAVASNNVNNSNVNISSQRGIELMKGGEDVVQSISRNSSILLPSLQITNSKNITQSIGAKATKTRSSRLSFAQQRRWRRYTYATISHFLRLLSPSNILRYHSLLEYIELVLLSSATMLLIFDYRLYPRYRMEVVEGLKHASILLESCLALPQAMQNYARGTTEGLSVVMVGGWVAGDFMKLCYFLLRMISDRVAATSGVTEKDIEGRDGNNVFVLGCILALSMDLLVGFQMAYWFPSQELTLFRERITRSYRHLVANKDDDGGAALFIKSGDSNYKKAGLFTSFVKRIFQRKRSRGIPDTVQKNAR